MSKINFKASIVFHKIWEALNAKIKTSSGLEHTYKLILEEGSSRSTKTWSNFQVLFLYLYENPISSATVLRDTQKSCREIVEKDWKEWLKDPMIRKKQLERGEISIQEFDKLIKEESLAQYFIENKTNHTWTFKHNGNMLRFTGLDDEDDAMGMTQTICWINEPYSFSHEVYRQLAQRSKVILFDWNPKQNHWIEKEKLKSSTFVNYSTFLDNPFLPAESRNQLLSYQGVKFSKLVKEGLVKESDAFKYDFKLNPLELNDKDLKELQRCVYNEIVKSASDYHWMVYGLGLKSEKPNKIYSGWKAITLEKYNSIKEREYFGLDFGWANPTALVGVKYDGDKTFYVRPALYKGMNDMKSPSGIPIPLGEVLISCGFPVGNVTYCWADSSDREAGSEISLIKTLRNTYKLNVVPTKKPTYKARWEFITKMNVYYVEDADFEHEYENYELEFINGDSTGKPIKKWDHCFVGETLISTPNGNVQIKDIKEGDYVLTSKGKRKVLKTWNNGIKNTYEYVLYYGDKSVTLNCTENHKIKTNLGWIEISKLKEGMTVFLNNTTTENLSNCNQEKITLITEETGCIDSFGKPKQVVKYLKALKSTTLMKIHTIIGLKTLNLLKGQNTGVCISKKGGLKTLNFLMKFREKPVWHLRNGIVQNRELSGIDNTQRTSISDIRHTVLENVSVVDLSLKQKPHLQNFVQESAFQRIDGIQGLIMRKESVSTAPNHSRQVNIQEIKIAAISVGLKQERRVYDLTVEKNHEYFANGVLVHNCMNALEYCCMGIKEYLNIQI